MTRLSRAARFGFGPPLLAAFALFALVLGPAPTANAQPESDDARRIVIVTPPSRSKVRDKTAQQLETLLVAECTSAGFTPIVRNSSKDDVSLHEVEKHLTENQTGVAVVLVKHEALWDAEVWQLDSDAGKTVVRRLNNDRPPPDSRPPDVALRAVDLLRAALMAGVPQDAPPPVVVAAAAIAPPPPPPRGWANGLSLGLGIAGLAGGGIGDPGLAAALAATFVTRMGFGAHLTATIPVSDTRLAAREGSTTISRATALVGPIAVFRRQHTLRPFAEFAVGGHLTRVQGAGVSSLFPGSSHSVAGFAASLGGGLAIALGDRFAVIVESQLLLLTPPTRLHIAGTQVAKLGGPTLFAGVWLAASL